MWTPSIEEQLVDQFYDWETWGRGYALWEAPVHLEPPFRPFIGHVVWYREIPDDGRRPTLLGQLRDLLRGAPPPQQAPSEEPEAPPEPRWLGGAPELLTFTVGLPRDLELRDEVTAAWLLSLRALRWPAAFELIGSERGIILQIAVRRGDEAALLAASRNAYPGMTLEPVSDALPAVTYQERLGVFEFGLRREFMIPIAAAGSRHTDPLTPIIAALEDTLATDMGAVQILFERADAPWAESIFRAVTDNEGGDFFGNAPHIATLGKRKGVQPLFGVVLRIAAGADEEATARLRLSRIAAALEHFGSPDRNEFHLLEDASPELPSDFLARQSRRSGMLLGIEELAAFVHPPSSHVHSRALLGRTARRSHALSAPETSGLYIGVNRHAGREAPVYLSLDRARRHVHVVGASGSGKSNLFLQLLLQTARQGGGFALLDPHGDLVDDVLARIPEERIDDVILFDPADTEHPVGFNVLAAHSDLERTLLASDLVAIFRRLSTSWGDQMHAVLANAIQAFLESERGGTIADLRKFLIDTEFRGEFLTTIPDPEIAYYWKKEFPLLHGRPQGPILTRLDAFLRPKLVRQMVTQKENRVDFRRVMDDGKILLAKLAQGAIGEENAALLGSFLVAKLHQTAISRQDVRASERRPFIVAADECQHFVTPSMASILSGARKYSVGLLLAHQDLTQLQRRDGEVYASLFANAGTRVVFRVSDADARALAEGFADFEADDLRSLSPGEAICRFDRADHDFNLTVPLVEPLDENEAAMRRERIIEASRLRYGRQHAEAAPEKQPADIDHEPEPPPSESKPRPPDSREQSAAPRQPQIRVKKDREQQALGRGGAQHKYLQELVKRFAEAQGYRSTIEKPTPNGGSVDVALEREGSRIAVEISVTSTADYEAGNVAKCVAAGYDRVVVIGPDRRRLDAIEKTVRSALADADRTRVDFRLPEEFLTYLASQTPPAPSEQHVGGYKVRVNYKKTTDEEAVARRRAVAEIVAKSVRKLDDDTQDGSKLS